MLGTTYRKAEIVGPDGVGRNYMMMKLEKVGRVPQGSNSHSKNGSLDTSILTILSAILSSVLALILPESIPGDIQGLRW